MAENNLDEFIVDDENSFSNEDLASKGQRFINYIIDLVVYLVCVFLLVAMFGAESAATYLAYVVWALYYVILELTTGKSLGKMITRTSVVSTDGEPLTIKHVLIRTVCRFVPFEAFSIFFGPDNNMWHDQWSDTMVVKDRK